MITYDLRNGLDTKLHILGQQQADFSLHIPGSSLAPIAEDGPDALTTHEVARRSQLLKKSRRTLTTLQTKTDDADHQLLFVMPWGANFEHPIGEMMVAGMAIANPDADIITWNAFGHGEQNVSSKIRGTAIRNARKTGSFDLVGKEYADRINILLDSDLPLDVVGASEGARIALSAIAHLCKKVRNVTLLDGPGTLGIGYFSYAKRFLSEQAHSLRYTAVGQDEKLMRLVEEHNATRARTALKDLKRGIILDHYYRSPSAMAKRGLETDLLLAAPHITGRLSFILPEFTALNDKQTVIEALQNTAVQEESPQTELWTFAGTHAFINAGIMPVAGLLAYVSRYR